MKSFEVYNIFAQVKMLVRRNSFVRLFTPWQAIILEKQGAMTLTKEVLERHQRLAVEIADMMRTGDDSRIDSMLLQLDELEKEVHESAKPIGFRNKGEEQPVWQVASTYADEWPDS